MRCDICGGIGEHNKRCPNYHPLKAIHYCSICEERIFDGEEYIENDRGEFRHFECFKGVRELLNWLGYDIKTVEEIGK